MPSTELHKYFSRFSKILKNKGVSEEELFDKLFYKKSNLDNDFREPIVDHKRAYKESKYVIQGNGTNYIQIMPNELMLLVMSYLDPLHFSRIGGICKDWKYVKNMKGVSRIYKS
jgi:hypothetical protein